MKLKLIAPCGMNCGICHAYLREKNKCPGCRSALSAEVRAQQTKAHARKSKQDVKLSTKQPNYCRTCIIKNCDILKEGRKVNNFCSTKCPRFACKRLKALDKRYRTKYGMSMIENLAYIEEHGIRAFVRKEKKRWVCKSCGKTLCVHRPNCIFCGAQK